jgi:hypothetical protein
MVFNLGLESAAASSAETGYRPQNGQIKKRPNQPLPPVFTVAPALAGYSAFSSPWGVQGFFLA